NCGTVYKGFAECLISLGDSISKNIQHYNNLENTEELHLICKSWDEFQKCTTKILVSCPKNAAEIWDSLLEESRKRQEQISLSEICRPQLSKEIKGVDSETNKETLKSLGCCLHFNLLQILLPIFIKGWIFQ
ncbi:hypothetical protein GDO86_008482, partial [Hymenochirus boettgeri]